MLEFNGTAVSRISGHLKCLQTVKKQSAHFHVGVLMTREMMRENGWCYAASIPGELWLISGAPPPPPAKKRQPVKEAASFTFNRWQCSLLASFWKTGRACKLQNVCQLTCVCVRNTLFARPSLCFSQQSFTLFCKGRPRFQYKQAILRLPLFRAQPWGRQRVRNRTSGVLLELRPGRLHL